MPTFQPPHGAPTGVGVPSEFPALHPAGLSPAVLDLLPVGLCRWDLGHPVALDISADLLYAELRERGRIGYLNQAHARLLGADTPAEYTGVRLAELAAHAGGLELEEVRRFVECEFRLQDVLLRLAGRDRNIRVVQGSWLGVVEGERLTAIWTILQEAASAPPGGDQGPSEQSEPILGRSPGIAAVLEKVRQVAGTDTTVLIRGETGTGKELIANAIHAGSARRSRPLVAVNCGAIASGLVESELFGHEKGAFTGALTRKIGRFEQADGGTLFLDEIGDLAPDLQVKLLRVLQEGELNRVGGTQPIRVDVRVIAATHRDLPAMVQRGDFRQDLYYRLNVFPILVPPLRDRREDIPLLAEHLTARYAARMGKRIDTIPQALLDRLAVHPWPGNIRELANLLERAVIVTPGRSLQLPEWATGQHTPVAATPSGPNPRALLDVEREHILRTLERTGWKVSGPGGAAEALGLKPTTLEARMKKLGVVRPRGSAG
jgi:DNA-binding NtrC family response regulator